MRFYFLLFIFSHFFAGECWAKDRRVASTKDHVINNIKEDMNFSIPLPTFKSKGGYYETTPRNYIDVNYKHLEYERSYGLGFTISF